MLAVATLRVGPGQLHLCAERAQAADVLRVRCELLPGVYVGEAIQYYGPTPLEIFGSGPSTILDGSEPISNASWSKVNASNPEDGRYWTSIVDPSQRRDYVQAFQLDGANFSWMPEARFPNLGSAELDKVLKLTSWGFCGEGSAKGKCVDRPDAWSDLSKPSRLGVHVDWTGALATLNIASRYATYTRTVESYTRHAAKGQFTFRGDLGPGPGSSGSWVGGRYFLSGVFDALDAPGEWWVDSQTWTAYAWMRDGAPPADRFRLKARSYCVESSNAAVTIRNVSFRGCTFRLRNCSTNCLVSDVDLDFPSYTREIHLRDMHGPFTEGPPPNHTIFEADNSAVRNLALRHSNAAGLKVVGSNNSLSELLIERCDWLGTLDYPPLEIGFDHDKLTNTSTAGLPGLRMYPRATRGVNNVVTRATVRHGGNALVVTSQLANEVSYSHIYDGGLIGRDDALLHADNSAVSCMDYHLPPERRANCTKTWHHNWVRRDRDAHGIF
jgi:hypothetical protein